MLIQLPDNPNSALDCINMISPSGANYSMNDFIIIDDVSSGRKYFGQITGPQRNLNRTGLGEYDQTTITGLELVLSDAYGRDSVVQEIPLYSVRLQREVTSGVVEVVVRRPQIASKGHAASEVEVVRFLGLPTPRQDTIVGRIPGTEVGIYYDAKTLTHHTLVAGSTGSGKSNGGGNIIKAGVNLGFGTIIYDHKPDYQDIHYVNLEADTKYQQALDVEYWHLGRQKKANGNSILVPASAFTPGVLAATFFWNENETQQREEMEHGLEVYHDLQSAAGNTNPWTLNEWFWWYTANQGSAANAAQVQPQSGHLVDKATLAAMLRKIGRRNRRPEWVDGVDIGSPIGATRTGGVMGRSSASAFTNWFDPVGLIQPAKTVCIKVNGSEAGREYGLFLDFMLKRIYRARANGELSCPVHHFIDEAQDIFSGSKRFAEAASRSLSTQIRKGRSLAIAFTIAVQSADQVPDEILNNLNSRVIMRHNNSAAAKAALEKATPEQINQTAYFGPGQSLIDLFGSNAVIQAQMLRSPFALTIDGAAEFIEAAE